jgi:hypothetical protein
LVRATAKLGGETRKLFFAMRNWHQATRFIVSYTNATQQALLKRTSTRSSISAACFVSCARQMSSLVKKILRGRQRIETSRIIAFARTGAFRPGTAIRPAAREGQEWKES